MKYFYNFSLKSILFILLINVLFVSYAKAQTCKDVFNFCDVDDIFFNKRALARSYKIQPSQKLQLLHLFYGSTGYQINICKDDGLGDFKVRIIDYKTQSVLWDNSEDRFDCSISISFGVTQKIIIEIIPQSPEKFNGLSQCVGVIINYHPEEEANYSIAPEDLPGI